MREYLSRQILTSCAWRSRNIALTRARAQRRSSTLFQPVEDASGGIKPWYITTPIFYVNACAAPHVGHLHSLVLSDVLARYSRLRYPERQVIFSTGTDEHGLKIQQAAKAEGVVEQHFCDTVSQRFRDLAEKANISHTTFIRTSETRHYEAVEHFWNLLVESGDVYKGIHEGWYSISDECFYSMNQVQERDGKVYAIETGNEVVWEEEENWKFRLGHFKEVLAEWATQPGAIQPAQYQAEVVSQIPSLNDLSISRPASRVKWGVPVPGDSAQTIYVWVDALINYLTVTGYPQEAIGWPADVHLVGKDIIRFHAIHWPALLMAAGLQPPRHVLAHAHWTMAKSKMSKSRGNVVDPIASMDKWGVDGIRWYLMRAGGGLPVDADYSEEGVAVNYGFLADQIGNLLSRVSSPKVLSRMQPWSESLRLPHLDEKLSMFREEYEKRMESVGISRACELVGELMLPINKFITMDQPWSKVTPSSTQSLVYAYHALRFVGIAMQPVIPGKAAELLDRLGVPPAQRGWDNMEWPVEVNTEVIREGLLQQKQGRAPHWIPVVKVDPTKGEVVQNAP